MTSKERLLSSFGALLMIVASVTYGVHSNKLAHAQTLEKQHAKVEALNEGQDRITPEVKQEVADASKNTPLYQFLPYKDDYILIDSGDDSAKHLVVQFTDTISAKRAEMRYQAVLKAAGDPGTAYNTTFSQVTAFPDISVVTDRTTAHVKL